jgi:hypothetical protein
MFDSNIAFSKSVMPMARRRNLRKSQMRRPTEDQMQIRMIKAIGRVFMYLLDPSGNLI